MNRRKGKGWFKGCFIIVGFIMILIVMLSAYGLGILHGEGLSVSDVVATAEAIADP